MKNYDQTSNENITTDVDLTLHKLSLRDYPESKTSHNELFYLSGGDSHYWEGCSNSFWQD